MSPEERQLLTSLFDRVRSAGATPRDADAEALITQSVRDQPYAPYYLAQAVIMQEQGMKAAVDRIQQLEARVRQLEQEGANQPQAQQSGGFLGGLGSLFGGGQAQVPQRAPAPQGYGPQGGYSQQTRGYDDYGRGAPPQQSSGPWGQQQPTGPWNAQPSGPSAGGGFLRGALGTAAGVAGGVMLAEGISSLFSPHVGGLGGLGSGLGGLGETAAAAPVEETVINNYYGSDPSDQNNNDNIIDASDDNQDDFGNDDFDTSDDSYNV